MKQITINGKVYDIDCNAYTYVQYKSIFKEGMVKDLQKIREYLIKQTVVSNQVNMLNLNEADKTSKIADFMRDDVDEFIVKITQIAWIMIYTANNKIEQTPTTIA